MTDHPHISKFANSHCNDCNGKGFWSGLNFEQETGTAVPVDPRTPEKKVRGLVWLKQTCPCTHKKLKKWLDERIVKPEPGDVLKVTEVQNE